MSDEAVKKATGSTWAAWVEVLDRAKGKEMSHGDLAKHIQAHHHTPDWWTQMVAVGYERIRGLRALGQRRSGEWEVSKSKTVAAPAQEGVCGIQDGAGPGAVAGRRQADLRTASPEKSMRVRFEDGSPVDVYFVPRGEAKSQVTIHHRKLASKADADRLRTFWSERLEALASTHEPINQRSGHRHPAVALVPSSSVRRGGPDILGLPGLAAESSSDRPRFLLTSVVD